MLPLTNPTTAKVVIWPNGFYQLHGQWNGGAASGCGHAVSTATDVRFDSAANMYVADAGNNRVLMFPPGAVNASAVGASPISAPME